MIRIWKFIGLLLVLFCLFGCTKEVPEDYSVAGKTYYDTTDTYVAKEPNTVWFGTDNSFVVNDYHSDGVDEYIGTWSIKDRVVTCNAKDKTIIFEAVNDDTVILRTDLIGSGKQATFSTERPASTIAEPSNPGGIGEGFAYVTYFNSSQNGTVASSLELRSDGSFTLLDYRGMETVEVNGLWRRADNGMYMFSNFNAFKNADNETIYNFEMMQINDNVFRLETNLAGSFTGEYFTTDGKKYSEDFGDSYSTTTWIHEKIEDVSEEYLPKLTIATDYSFKYTENVYSGMVDLSGYCQKTNNGWTCDVLDNSGMQGFAGGDVKVIEFTENDGYLYLQTELCMSRAGDRFVKGN